MASLLAAPARKIDAATAAVTTRQKDNPTLAIDLYTLRLPSYIAGGTKSYSYLRLSANCQAREKATRGHMALGPIPAYR